MSEAEQCIKKVTRCGDNYYAILGLEKSASEDEIKKAYRKLALRLHPDKCKETGAEEAFKRVNEAFSVLSDKDKRPVYDQHGVDGLSGGGGRGGGGGINPEDIFEAFFGGQGFPGGATFVQQGGRGGGFQTFSFSSGGPGMGGGIHFANLGGGSPFGNLGGGQRVRINQQRQSQQRQQEAEAEQEAQESPQWLKTMKVIADNLGPLLPFAIMAVMFLGVMLFARLVQFFIQRIFILLPIMYLAEGRTKLILLSAAVGLGVLGVI